jgi:hypothetical protein
MGLSGFHEYRRNAASAGECWIGTPYAYTRHMVATVKPMSQIGDRGEPARIRETTTMKKLLTAAFAIVAALVALVSAHGDGGWYQHMANRRTSTRSPST